MKYVNIFIFHIVASPGNFQYIVEDNIVSLTTKQYYDIIEGNIRNNYSEQILNLIKISEKHRLSISRIISNKPLSVNNIEAKLKLMGYKIRFTYLTEYEICRLKGY